MASVRHTVPFPFLPPVAQILVEPASTLQVFPKVCVDGEVAEAHFLVPGKVSLDATGNLLGAPLRQQHRQDIGEQSRIIVDGVPVTCS